MMFAFGSGLVIIAPSGDNFTGPVMPGRYPQTIAVSGVSCTSGSRQECSSRSSVKRWSGDIPVNYHDISAAAEDILTLRTGTKGGGTKIFNGLSAASPIVTAAIAVAYQKFPNCRPLPGIIRDHIKSTAWQTNDHDPTFLGAGVLNAGIFWLESSCNSEGGPPGLDP